MLTEPLTPQWGTIHDYARHLPNFMNIMHTKDFPKTPFSITCSPVKNEPGTWDSTKVSIYRDDTLIGEYIRNYSSYGTDTFYPFKQGDVWYALYSAGYTATRVMKLHDDRIEDWCGEEAASNGFCPVEFYIPRYVMTKHSYTHGNEIKDFECYTVDCNTDPAEFLEEFNTVGAESDYCKFGFLSGCVWGDDSSWKIRYIDLSKIGDKILSITDKFGYLEMPADATLKDCVNMNDWEPTINYVVVTRAERFNLSAVAKR